MEDFLLQKAKKIKLLMLDVDGVLTDGRIIYDSKARDLKLFDVHDGMGVHLLKKAGIPTVLVTARSSKAIKPRARDMGVALVFSDISPKSVVIEKVTSRFGVSLDEICFIGDDLVDACLMKRVGLPVAVFNACAEIKALASYITFKQGGRGAVREVVKIILRAQDKWQGIVESYQER